MIVHRDQPVIGHGQRTQPDQEDRLLAMGNVLKSALMAKLVSSTLTQSLQPTSARAVHHTRTTPTLLAHVLLVRTLILRMDHTGPFRRAGRTAMLGTRKAPTSPTSTLALPSARTTAVRLQSLLMPRLPMMPNAAATAAVVVAPLLAARSQTFQNHRGSRARTRAA